MKTYDIITIYQMELGCVVLYHMRASVCVSVWMVSICHFRCIKHGIALYNTNRGVNNLWPLFKFSPYLGVDDGLCGSQRASNIGLHFQLILCNFVVCYTWQGSKRKFIESLAFFGAITTWTKTIAAFKLWPCATAPDGSFLFWIMMAPQRWLKHWKRNMSVILRYKTYNKL